MELDVPEEVLIACGVAIVVAVKRSRRCKRKWCKNWLLNKDRFSNQNLLMELALNEPNDYKNFLRMNETSFMKLLSKVRGRIQKKETLMRKAITPEQRLTDTLRFLATGNTYEDLKFCTAISPQALGQIIPESCAAIYEELKGEYLKFPCNENEWIEVARDFKNSWNFDTCVGAIDGKHISIVKPPNSGSYYYNYKGGFSIVLLAIVNAKYEFMFVHFGINGTISDGGVLHQTPLYEKLIKGSLKLPPPTTITGTAVTLPYVFLGDEAFPLMQNLLKPYSQRKELTKEERIYNYRLSRARRVVENAFGILASRFRVFHSDIGVSVDIVDYIVLAACVLHNFLIQENATAYIGPGAIDREDHTGDVIPGEWWNSQSLLSLQRTPRTMSVMAKQVRDCYKTYLNSEGCVNFQEKMASK